MKEKYECRKQNCKGRNIIDDAKTSRYSNGQSWINRVGLNVEFLFDGWSNMKLFAFQKWSPKVARSIKKVGHGRVDSSLGDNTSDPKTWRQELENMQRENLGYFRCGAEFLLFRYGVNMIKIEDFRSLFSPVFTFNQSEGGEDKRDRSGMDLNTLPPSLGDYLRSYLGNKGLTQKAFAGQAGVSTAVVSNVNKGIPVRQAYNKIINGFDITDEERMAVKLRYAPQRDRESIGREYKREQVERETKGFILFDWREGIFMIDRAFLDESGFTGGIEEFLATRYVNTATRIARIVQELESLPEQFNRNVLSTNFIFTDQSTIYPLDLLNQPVRFRNLLLQAWDARRLFDLPEAMSIPKLT